MIGFRCQEPRHFSHRLPFPESSDLLIVSAAILLAEFPMALTLERSGPRQIWRFVVFVAAAILMGRFVEGPVVEFVARHFGIDPDALSAPALIVDEVVSLAEVFVLTGLFALLERRRVIDYGLNLSPAPGKFFVK